MLAPVTIDVAVDKQVPEQILPFAVCTVCFLAERVCSDASRNVAVALVLDKEIGCGLQNSWYVQFVQAV